MEIKLNSNSFSYNLEIKDTNVFIEEDVTERTWLKDEEGKNKGLKMDISDEGLSMIATVMEDMIYYREAQYDSSTLIERLFEKLPAETMQTLLVELNKYKEE